MPHVLAQWYLLSPMSSFIYAVIFSWMTRETTLELVCNLWMNLLGPKEGLGPIWGSLQYIKTQLWCISIVFFNFRVLSNFAKSKNTNKTAWAVSFAARRCTCYIWFFSFGNTRYTDTYIIFFIFFPQRRHILILLYLLSKASRNTIKKGHLPTVITIGTFSNQNHLFVQVNVFV